MCKRMLWLVLVIEFAVMGFKPALGQAGTAAPRVAVFDIEDQTNKLKREDILQLTNYLASQMAEGGIYKVVPGSQIKNQLTEKKKESYKSCYDQQCQIEIGRELAAQKLLATQILKVGTKCAVIATLYDLKSAATEKSNSEKCACTQDDFVAALEKTVAKLKGEKYILGAADESHGTDLVSSGASIEISKKWRSKTIWAYSTLGVGLASVAGMGLMYGLGLSQGSDAYQQYRDAPDQTQREKYWNDVESSETKLLVGHVLLGVGVAALGFSLYEFITRPSVSDTIDANKASVKIGFIPLKEWVGISLTGQF